jgi:hypothetical protein
MRFATGLVLLTTLALSPPLPTHAKGGGGGGGGSKSSSNMGSGGTPKASKGNPAVSAVSHKKGKKIDTSSPTINAPAPGADAPK